MKTISKRPRRINNRTGFFTGTDEEFNEIRNQVGDVEFHIYLGQEAVPLKVVLTQHMIEATTWHTKVTKKGLRFQYYKMPYGQQVIEHIKVEPDPVFLETIKSSPHYDLFFKSLTQEQKFLLEKGKETEKDQISVKDTAIYLKLHVEQLKHEKINSLKVKINEFCNLGIFVKLGKGKISKSSVLDFLKKGSVNVELNLTYLGTKFRKSGVDLVNS